MIEYESVTEDKRDKNRFDLAMNDYLAEKKIYLGLTDKKRKFTKDCDMLDSQFPSEINSSFGSHSAVRAHTRYEKKYGNFIERYEDKSLIDVNIGSQIRQAKRITKQGSLMSTRSSTKIESTQNDLRLFRRLNKIFITNQKEYKDLSQKCLPNGNSCFSGYNDKINLQSCMRFDYDINDTGFYETKTSRWRIISDFILKENKENFNKNLANLNANVFNKLKGIMSSMKNTILRKKTLRKKTFSFKNLSFYKERIKSSESRYEGSSKKANNIENTMSYDQNSMSNLNEVLENPEEDAQSPIKTTTTCTSSISSLFHLN